MSRDARLRRSDGSFHYAEWPDLHRPLGAPLDDYKNTTGRDGSYLTRVFSTGTKVWMNASHGCVYWSDGFVTGGDTPCALTASALSDIFRAWPDDGRTS